MTQPNFVIILADDMGYGDASLYDGWIASPCLDRLAEQGLTFTDFHTSGTVCSPTRAGLLTGRYQERAGIPWVINADPAHPSHVWGLEPREITWPRLLGQAGYTTAVFGKWHLGYDRHFNPVHHGFDRFRGYVSGNVDYTSHYDRMGVYDWWEGLEHVQEAGYTTHLITRHAIDFIAGQAGRGPFCLYVAHEAVHTPFQGPDDPPQRGPAAEHESLSAAEKRSRYRTMMEELDTSVGEIVEALDRHELSEQTLVVFLSDNGAAGPGSNAPFKGGKGTVWEGGHRVPAVCRWPGTITAGTRTDALASSLDLMPTMLDAAGVGLPAGHAVDGVSLMPLLTGGTAPPPRQLFWCGQAVRDGQWKYVEQGGVGALFDLQQDPGETRDLAADQPERAARLGAALNAWRAEVGAPDEGVYR